MTRLTLVAAAAALSVLSAPAAFANAKQEKLCDDFAYMTQQLADLRADGSAQAEAQEIVAGQYEADQLTYLQMVPQLAAFVYSLPDAQLEDDVEGAFAAQCKAHKG